MYFAWKLLSQHSVSAVVIGILWQLSAAVLQFQVKFHCSSSLPPPLTSSSYCFPSALQRLDFLYPLLQSSLFLVIRFIFSIAFPLFLAISSILSLYAFQSASPLSSFCSCHHYLPGFSSLIHSYHMAIPFQLPFLQYFVYLFLF